MLLPKAAILLAILSFSMASSTCDKFTAMSWPTSGGSSDDVCVQTCGQDSACLQACYAQEQQGDCNAVGCDESGGDGDGGNGDSTKKLRRQDTFTCTDSQTCYIYTNGILLCLDSTTGDYTDELGGTGNVNTGEYTSANGQETTVLAGQSATPTAVNTADSAATSDDFSAPTATTTDVSETETLSTKAVAAGSSATKTSTTTSATPNSSKEKTRAGAVVGVMALVVGLAL